MLNLKRKVFFQLQYINKNSVCVRFKRPSNVLKILGVLGDLSKIYKINSHNTKNLFCGRPFSVTLSFDERLKKECLIIEDIKGDVLCNLWCHF